MLSIKPFKRAAVPLLVIQTADPAVVVRLAVKESTNGKTYPVFRWDCIHGITGINPPAGPLADILNNGQDAAIATSNPIEALRAIEKASEGGEDFTGAVFVLLGMTGILDDAQSGLPAKQALWNLRDALMKAGILVIFTAPMGWRNPYQNDIAVAVDDLPDREELMGIVKRLGDKLQEIAPDSVPTTEIIEKAADALIGLSGFAAEQATALSLSKSGLDLGGLWARKRQQISETPGLSVYSGQERFADLGGLDQAKNMFRKILDGRRKPGAVIFIDEIEKSLAGSGGSDTSGVSQSMLGYLLSYMQDSGATGAIFLGPPGAAKSAMAKAIGSEGDIPTVQLDLGGIKGSLVGESEGRMRTALAVITAISAGRPMFIATCNSIGSLPPELRRRFTLGTMFFDLPSRQERDGIWEIMKAKFNIPEDDSIIADNGWTGAEIRQCCDLADRMNIPLVEAADFIVPVSVAAREQIEKLRTEASGRYLSASEPGVYRKPEAAGGGRKMEL